MSDTSKTFHSLTCLLSDVSLLEFVETLHVGIRYTLNDVGVFTCTTLVANTLLVIYYTHAEYDHDKSQQTNNAVCGMRKV